MVGWDTEGAAAFAATGTGHRLDALLRPRSIAVLGASARAHSVGNYTLVNLLEGKYPGRLYAINPGYDSVLGVPCVSSMANLPEPVEHVIFALADSRIEQALEQVLAQRPAVTAVTIMSALVLAQEQAPTFVGPTLKERVQRRLLDTGTLACGGNGMGFYHFPARVRVCGFDTRAHRNTGNVAYISQSGSGMCGIVDVEERIDFSLVVSTGQELVVSLEAYLAYALQMPQTRVIGLFMETSRDPPALMRGLAQAQARGIPVVALKVGRTELSARLAVSHCGAMAGNDAAFDAVFARYGVRRVADMDEMANALIMFAQPHPIGRGALVSLHDSGGERQLAIDVADEIGVPYAQIAKHTEQQLADMLDPGLAPVNPLDGWSAGGEDADAIMARCMAALLCDPQAAVGAVIHDRAPHSGIYPSYLQYLHEAHEASGKPVFLVSNRQGTGSDPLVVSITREGFAVIDGLRGFMQGVAHLFAWRDHQNALPLAPAPDIPYGVLEKWRHALVKGGQRSEEQTLQMLADFGMPVNPYQRVSSVAELEAAAAQLGFPLVLKTAAQAIAHKSDHGGVVLNIVDLAQLRSTYAQMSERLGMAALLSAYRGGGLDGGVEMILGGRYDEQFGAVVVIGFGGVHTEVLRDTVSLLAPFGADQARAAVRQLRHVALLGAWRGRRALDIESFCIAAARFSAMLDALGAQVAEIDVNPVKVLANGCLALDGLMVAAAAAPQVREEEEQK